MVESVLIKVLRFQIQSKKRLNHKYFAGNFLDIFSEQLF